jgi:hypothetical protein
MKENETICRLCGAVHKLNRRQKLVLLSPITAKQVLIGILFPPLGFALWGLDVKEDPGKAKNYLRFSLLGVLVYIVAFVIVNMNAI